MKMRQRLQPAAEGQSQRPRTSLPFDISDEMRAGKVLAGDDFTDQQLATWFDQEKEAFYQADAGNSAVDPWYTYMRFVNEMLGFSRVEPATGNGNSVLVIGPGSGTEITKFAQRHPEWQLCFLEASEHFRVALKSQWPDATVARPAPSGDIELDDGSQALVCAFSVLHHIPNVSKVVCEVGRVLKADGVFLVREPCSSMGDWRAPRSATPNERGISRALLVDIAGRHGMRLLSRPVPILFEPLNRILKRSVGFGAIPFPALYAVDRVISRLVSFNDHYWRDAWFKRIGPSSYFYVFKKANSPSGSGSASRDEYRCT